MRCQQGFVAVAQKKTGFYLDLFLPFIFFDQEDGRPINGWLVLQKFWVVIKHMPKSEKILGFCREIIFLKKIAQKTTNTSNMRLPETKSASLVLKIGGKGRRYPASHRFRSMRHVFFCTKKRTLRKRISSHLSGVEDHPMTCKWLIGPWCSV